MYFSIIFFSRADEGEYPERSWADLIGQTLRSQLPNRRGKTAANCYLVDGGKTGQQLFLLQFYEIQGHFGEW